MLSSPARLTTVTVSWSVFRKKTTDKLQRVLDGAARIVSESPTATYDRGLNQLRRCQLHWQDVVDRVRFRICVQVFKCLTTWRLDWILSSLCQPAPGTMSSVWSSTPALGRSRRPRTENGRSPTPFQQYGTHYPTTWKTLIFFCQPLNAILRLSFYNTFY